MSRLNQIKELINNYERRLHKLKLSSALKGISTPPEDEIEMEDLEEKIETLKAEQFQLEIDEVGEVTSEKTPSSKPSSSYDSKQKHLQQRWKELQPPLETLNKRIAALRTDFSRTLDSDRRVTLKERLAEVETERTEILAELEEIEAQLNNTNTTNNISQPTPKSLDKAILQTLYDYYLNHPGDPQMSLNALVERCEVSKTDVINYLHKLKEQGWVDFELLEQAESGLVELTTAGRKVAQDK